MFDVVGQRNVQGGINKHPDQLFPCFHKETIVSVAHLLFHQGEFSFHLLGCLFLNLILFDIMNLNQFLSVDVSGEIEWTIAGWILFDLNLVLTLWQILLDPSSVPIGEELTIDESKLSLNNSEDFQINLSSMVT